MEWMLLPLKRYAEFSGRSRRMEFWMFTLGVFLLYLVFMVVAMVIGLGAMGMATSGSGGLAAGGMMGFLGSMGILAIVFVVIWLGLIVPTLAVQVRRLHDTDRSGWWVMIYWGPVLLSWVLSVGAAANGSTGVSAIGGIVSLLGLIGAIVLLVFWCLPGTTGPNRYGPDPLGGASNLGETFS